MKIIKSINVLIFSITLVLYLTIFYGMIAQFFLGIIQIILSIIIYKKHRALIDSYIKPFCLTYVFLSISVFIALPLCKVLESIFIIVLFVIPMCLAGLHLYITIYLSKKEN